MRDPSKLEPLQEIFDKYKTDEIVGVWTDGSIEVVVFTDSRDYKTSNSIVNEVAELFNMEIERVGGGVTPTDLIDDFKELGCGYYVY